MFTTVIGNTNTTSHVTPFNSRQLIGQHAVFLTSGTCEATGQVSNELLIKLGLPCSSFNGEDHPLTDAEMQLIAEDCITLSPNSDFTLLGYSALLNGKKYLAPTTEFGFKETCLHSRSRMDAYKQADTFRTLLSGMARHTNGYFAIREVLLDADSEGHYACELFIPMEYALRSASTLDGWKAHLQALAVIVYAEAEAEKDSPPITLHEERMNHIISNLSMADIIRVNGGPLLTSYEHEEDGAIAFTWVDDDGDHFSEYVNAEEVAKSQITGNTLVMVNTLSETIRVELFNLAGHDVILPINQQALSQYIADKLADNQQLEATLIEALDDQVHDFIGGYRATPINNQGPAHQVMELAAHGFDDEAIDTLAHTFSQSPHDVAQVIRSHELASSKTAEAAEAA